jgi:hypothetical protein
MGILAQHVPSIEQLKPGLVEIIEESGGSKQFFRAFALEHRSFVAGWANELFLSVWGLRNRSAKFTIEHKCR